MKKISVAVIGGGSRGGVYASYSLSHPHEVEIVAVAEPNQEKREQFKKLYNLSEDFVFTTWEDLLDKPKFADAVVVSTMDRMHYKPTMKALSLGYHVLLEKPMSVDPVECIVMGEAAKVNNRVFQICHCMRYAPISHALKKVIDEKRIGDIVTIQHTENVAHWHHAHSFVRGNWRNSDESSPMILQKCCHDMDFLLWIIGSKCVKISSFGSLTYFKEENAPEGAPLRCMDGCPAEMECPYYAPGFYANGKPGWPNYCVSLDTSIKAVTEALKTSPYGRCVYHCDNNVVDHQVASMEFENGVTVAFTMTAFTSECSRTIKIMGTKGQIRMDMNNGLLEISDFITNTTDTIQIKIIDQDNGHGGADEILMHDFVRLVQKDGIDKGLSPASVSVQSHLMAFAAEKSRLEDKVIFMKEYEEELRKKVNFNDTAELK